MAASLREPLSAPPVNLSVGSRAVHKTYTYQKEQPFNGQWMPYLADLLEPVAATLGLSLLSYRSSPYEERRRHFLMTSRVLRHAHVELGGR